MSDLTLRPSSEIPENECIRIKKTDHHFHVSGIIRNLKFRDQDTRQVVIYLPSFEVTGYGATEEKALEMVKFCLNDFLDYLSSLPPKKINAELKKLGWNQDKFKHKHFSKVFVDVDGELKNFNAVAGEVEIGALTI